MTFAEMLLGQVDNLPKSLPRQAKILLSAITGLVEVFSREDRPEQEPEFDPSAYLAEEISNPVGLPLLPADLESTFAEASPEYLVDLAQAMVTASSNMQVAEQQAAQAEQLLRLNSGRFFTQVSEMPAYVSQSTSDDEDFI